jgi:hypothetical protein
MDWIATRRFLRGEAVGFARRGDGAQARPGAPYGLNLCRPASMRKTGKQGAGKQ